MTKVCSRCGGTKPLDDFHRSRQKKDGRKSECKQCRRIQTTSREHVDWVLNHRYGLGLAEYEARLAAQGGGCAICEAPEPGAGRGRFVVDHDHSCCPGRRSCGGCVRGLLCVACNLILGRVEDNPDRLRSAARYLTRWAAA